MSRSLYEINNDLEMAIELGYNPETGEILADIDAIKMEREEKIRNCACFVLNEKAFIETLKAQKKALESRIREHERKADYVSDMLKDVLDGEKVETEEFAIKYTKAKETVITDLSRIPEVYMRVKTETSPNLALIKEAIVKGGLDVPGAIVVDNVNMVIK